MKKLLLLLVMLFMLSGCFGLSENEKSEQIIKLVIAEKYDEAEKLANKYYENDASKLAGTLMYINSEKNEKFTELLTIQDGWKWIVDGNYTYVRGRVKNTSGKTINYFKIVAHYKNKAGEVIDTDYTNSGETLGPGMSKEFEIMHRDSDEYHTVSIFVEKASFN